MRSTALAKSYCARQSSATCESGKQATVTFLMDSGAKYTLVPAEQARLLELQPKRIVTFTLADGTAIERGVSECHLSLPQGEGHTPVILGEPGDERCLAPSRWKSLAWC